MHKSLIPLTLVGAAIAIGGCGSNADTVSKNISKDAEQFRVGRRIVVTNGITDKPVFLVEGRCSWETPTERKLEVVCKDGPRKYTKATIGLGDNTTWASVQLGPINESEYRTKIVLRPESLIPDLDLVTGYQAAKTPGSAATGPTTP